MSLTKENTNNSPSKEEKQNELLVSNEGVYLRDDATGKFIKEMHELIRQTIFMPVPPAKGK
ncbi:MAG: hypothetical protein JST68_06050 [Bacteroidetes bacterium]|nr:hypothetical protein [Bacteroidota bacterium]